MSNIINSDVKKFGELFALGMTSLAKACKIYADAITKNPDIKSEFEAAYPQISRSGWQRFELFGRGALDERLVVDLSTSTRELVKVPLSEQREAIESGILVLERDGTLSTVEYQKLNNHQIKQVFAADHIRSVDEQEMWLKDQNHRIKPTASETKAWEIRDGKLIVNKPQAFDISELCQILTVLG